MLATLVFIGVGLFIIVSNIAPYEDHMRRFIVACWVALGYTIVVPLIYVAAHFIIKQW